MKRLLLISFIFLSLTSSAFAFDTWDKTDKALAVTMSTLIIVDWGQTLNITRSPAYYETNPLLGSKPSEKDIHLYMASAVVGTLAISHIFPSNFRKAFLLSVIAIELDTIYHNYSVGLTVQF